MSQWEDDSPQIGDATLARIQAAADAPHPDVLIRINGFHIGEKIGEGGMGVVWRAEQISANRPVALKTTSAASFGSDRARRRWIREVELTAMLEHPNIARLYESGSSDGVFFYAMELIEGENLDIDVKRRALSIRKRIELMEVICRAVQYAHQKGIIHRDLKPSNIMVDKEGKPHVLDFGLARALECDMQLSIDGEIAGTLKYMSPEQAAGKATDTRSDVYSLGVILFNLLCDQFPHDVSGSVLEIMRRIAESEPRQLKDIQRKTDRDLNVLLSKALSKDPKQRYGTAGEFADDLGRYLWHEPLNARPPTLGYLVDRKIRKHKVPVAAAAIFLAILIGTAIFSYLRIRQEKNTAVTANIEKEHERQVAEEQRKEALIQRDLALKNEQKAIEATRSADERLAESFIAQGDAYQAGVRWEDAKNRYTDAYDRLLQMKLSPIRAVTGLCTAYSHAPVPLLTNDTKYGKVISIAMSSDGRTVYSAHPDETIRAWDAYTGVLRNSWQRHAGTAMWLRLSHDGRKLLSGGANGIIELYDIPSNTSAEWRATANYVMHGCFSADDKEIITSGGDGSIHIWNALTRTLKLTLQESGSGVYGIAFSPDEKFAYSGHGDGILLVWNLQDKSIEYRIHAHGWHLSGINVDPVHHRMVTSSGDGEAKLWDLRDRMPREMRTFKGHGGYVYDAQFSLDGSKVLTSSADRTARVWNVESGEEISALTGHESEVLCAAFLADDGILTGGMDGTIRLWPVAERRASSFMAGMAEATSVAISHDGSIYVTCLPDGYISIGETRTGKILRRCKVDSIRANSLALSTDGKSVLSGGGDGIEVTDVDTGQEVCRLASNGKPVSTVSFCGNDSHLAVSAGANEPVCYWDLDARKLIRAVGRQSEWMRNLSVSPDGKYVLCGIGNDAVLWDLASGTRVQVYHGHGNAVATTAFSSDGKNVITSGWDHEVRIWNLTSGELLSKMLGHEDHVTSIDVARIAPFAVSGGADDTTRLWDLTNRKEVQTLSRTHTGVRCVAIAPSGDFVIAIEDRGLVIWRFDITREIRQLAETLPPLVTSLKRNPKDAPALFSLGKWYQLRGFSPGAEALLSDASRCGISVPHRLLAECYWDSNNCSKSLEQFRAAQREASCAHAGLWIAALTPTRP